MRTTKGALIALTMLSAYFAWRHRSAIAEALTANKEKPGRLDRDRLPGLSVF